MNRTTIINLLIEHYKYKTYLEIGVKNPNHNFNKIECERKFGVDPKVVKGHNGLHIWRKTSDQLFSYLPVKGYSFDLIFIDGDHTEEQVTRDIINSFSFLRGNGCIVLHDVNPLTEEMQIPKKKGCGNWSGTVWKAFIKCRSNCNLRMFTVDCDFGIGIIKKGCQPGESVDLPPAVRRTYDWFDKNRKVLLNLIPAIETNIKFELEDM